MRLRRYKYAGLAMLRCCICLTCSKSHLFLQVIGVGAAVLGDMSSRPYWGLYELDFVFCTIIVGQPI